MSNTTTPGNKEARAVEKAVKKIRPRRKTNPSFNQLSRNIPNQVGGPLGSQLRALSEPLTSMDAAVFGYLNTVSNPWIARPTGVPLIMGSGGLITSKAQVRRTVTVTCNASGFGFLAVNNDGWAEEQTIANTYQYASYNGGTQGTDIWYTANTYVGTATPAPTATTATAGLLSVAMPLVDGSWDAYTGYRQVACGLRCWSDAAQLNASGDVYVLSTNQAYATNAEGSLVSTTEAYITTISQTVLAREVAPLPGWKSGEVMSTFSIPTQQFAFQFRKPPAVGSVVYGYPAIGIIITGAQSGQTFKVEVCKVFEFDFQQSYLVDVEPEPTLSAPAEDLMNGLRLMHKNKVAAPAPMHASSLHNGAGPQAFVENLAVTRPAKIPSLNEAVKGTSPAKFLDSAVSSGLGWLADKAKNLLPGWAKKGLDLLGSFF